MVDDGVGSRLSFRFSKNGPKSSYKFTDYSTVILSFQCFTTDGEL